MAILLDLFASQNLTANLCSALPASEIGEFVCRRFPDGETYIRVETPVKNKEVIIVAELTYPDDKILPLIFLVQTLKSLGANSIGLVAPYLPYMRQDTRFQMGEGVTSNYFAELLSHYFAWLITIDPHLHRHHSLSEIYTIPAKALHATDLIVAWIHQHIENPLIIGPDAESEQWVAPAAERIQVPYMVLQKIRHGDRTVEIEVPDLSAFKNYVPVLIDDIISTGKTLLNTVAQLLDKNPHPPICVAVHGLFVENAYESLLRSGIGKIITCNTVAHQSNLIDVSQLLVQAILGTCTK